MNIYDNNRGSIVIPKNSVLPSLNSNRGSIVVGPNCRISECNDNRGSIQFGRGLCIRNINNNRGRITIGADSKVDLISDNRGSITLASDCLLSDTKNNTGSITTADFQFPSDGNSYNFQNNPTNISSSSVVIDGNSYNFPYNSTSIVIDVQGSTTVLSGRGKVSITNSYSNSKSSSSDRHIEDKYSTPADPVVRDGDERICAICLGEPKTIAFQCGHMCCTDCSKTLTTCHICRAKINQKIKLFF